MSSDRRREPPGDFQLPGDCWSVMRGTRGSLRNSRSHWRFDGEFRRPSEGHRGAPGELQLSTGDGNS
eukprot:3817782-Pyramimonas_sp.AAC.1